MSGVSLFSEIRNRHLENRHLCLVLTWKVVGLKENLDRFPEFFRASLISTNSCLGLNGTFRPAGPSCRWSCRRRWTAPQGSHPGALHSGLVVGSRCCWTCRRCLCWLQWCCCSKRKENTYHITDCLKSMTYILCMQISRFLWLLINVLYDLFLSLLLLINWLDWVTSEGNAGRKHQTWTCGMTPDVI